MPIFSSIKTLKGQMKRISLFKGPNFELSGFGLLISIIVGLVVGMSFYVYLQKDAQSQLIKAYSKANVLCSLFQKEPSFDQGECYDGSSSNEIGELLEQQTYNNHPLTVEELYLLFKTAGIVDPNEISLPEDIKDYARFPAAAYLTSTIQSLDELKSLNPDISTINMVIQLAGAFGLSNTMNHGENENLFYQFYLSNALANTQIVMNKKVSFFTFISNKMSSDDFQLDSFELPYKDNYWDTLPLSGLLMSSPPSIADADILSQLLIGKRVILGKKVGWGINKQSAFSQLNSLPNPMTPEQKYQVYQGSQKLLLYLISQLHSHQTVSDAREYAVKVRGWEQAGMFFLAAFILFIILLRFIRRIFEGHCLKKLFQINDYAFYNSKDMSNPEQHYKNTISQQLETIELNWRWQFIVGYDDAISRFKAVVQGKLKSTQSESIVDHLRAAASLKDDKLYGSRWLIRWAAMTLPALGFIGTVRGILTSLTGADAIVWATNQAERADAISQLAGELGLAFATTFIALIAGIVVSLFNEKQTKSEGTFIQELESWAVSALDIHLHELYGKKQNG